MRYFNLFAKRSQILLVLESQVLSTKIIIIFSKNNFSCKTQAISLFLKKN